MTGAPLWPRLTAPGLDINGGSGPYSTLYKDGYASAAGAVEETKFVFLDAIGAPDAWKGADTYCIGETGFGIGLNFLVTWELWRRTAPSHAQLHFVSIEGHPVSKLDLEKALKPYASHPNLGPLARELCNHYPVLHAGFHRLVLDGGRVRLTLLFDTIGSILPQLHGTMDAWFLDGFSPSKNPAMWTPQVLSTIAQKTKVEGIVATYTAAGAVRRALSDAGFKVEKRPGYAGKRERIVGCLQTPEASSAPKEPWYALPQNGRNPAKVAIVGAGIAGQWLNKSFHDRGIVPEVFDQAGWGGGMHGNPAAILIPKLQVHATPAGQINVSCFLHALRAYGELPGTSWHSPLGASLLTLDQGRAERIVKALNWPEDVLALAKHNDHVALEFRASGSLDTDRIRKSLITTISKRQISSIHKVDDAWLLLDSDGCLVWEGDTVVIASGGWSGLLLDAPWLGIRPSRGQVSFIKNDFASELPHTYSADGYLTPAIPLPGGATGRVLGSTFDELRRPHENENWRTWSEKDHGRYAKKVTDFLGYVEPVANGGWVGLRATTADRLPIVGPVPDIDFYKTNYQNLHHGKKWKRFPVARYLPDLYILSGLGSRGYQYAPLLSEVLVDQILGTPHSLGTHLTKALHPARFIIRNNKRRSKHVGNLKPEIDERL